MNDDGEQPGRNVSGFLWLRLYDAAWEPLLWCLRAAAWFERRAGFALLPASWKLPERLARPSPIPIPPSGERGGAVWMHAASLGESKGMWALARTLADLPVRFVLTVNTVAALEFLQARVRERKDQERWHVRLAPPDHSRIVKRFVDMLDIRALILFEVELWPNWMAGVRSAGGAVFWVSARVNARARNRIGWFPGVFRAMMEQVDWAQAQMEDDAELLREWGCARAEAGGDLRGLHSLEGMAATQDGRERSDRVAWKERRGAAFVSIHADELPALLPFLADARNEDPVIVFPRKPEELPAFRKALEPAGFVLHSVRPHATRSLVDSFGLVDAALARGRIAVIGGSFAPHGGHNLWEPLAAGVWMVTGPHHDNQKALATRLQDAGLLRISARLGDGDSLFAPDADPGEACANFARRERATLAVAATRVRETLEAHLRTVNRTPSRYS